MRPLPAILQAPDCVVGDTRLLLQFPKGEDPLPPQFQVGRYFAASGLEGDGYEPLGMQ